MKERTAEKVLTNLSKQIASISDREYERLLEITGSRSQSFLGLTEREIQLWLEWEKENNAAQPDSRSPLETPDRDFRGQACGDMLRGNDK